MNARQLIERQYGRPPARSLRLKEYPAARRNQAALLAGHMLIQEIPLATVYFVIRVYPIFLEDGQASATKMAEMAEMSPQAAGKHVKKLTDAGFFKRVHYRAWEIDEDYFHHLNR